jgi:hypothetical protein
MLMEVKIGDVVAWPLVPDGAMVLSVVPTTGAHWWYLRRGAHGDVAGIRWGGEQQGTFWAWSGVSSPRWAGWSPDDHRVTIVALGVSPNATAADLRRLAEDAT